MTPLLVLLALPFRGAVSTNWSENWEDGMVTGNGRMGALVYGKPEAPVLILTHNRLYTAEHDPAKAHPADTARFVPEIRRLIETKGYEAALDYSFRMSKENGLAPDEATDFHPGFFLRANLKGAEGGTGYQRSENFETGEVTTAWHGTAGDFQTRTFVSRKDNVAVYTIQGPAPFDADLTMDLGASKIVTSAADQGKDWMGLRVQYPAGNGGYDAVVRFTSQGGSATADHGHLQIRGARKVTFLMRIERFRPPAVGGLNGLASELSSLKPDYDKLLAPHAKLHGALFRRTSLDLGGAAGLSTTTDELLAQARREKKLSPALVEKLYDACRYLTICSSGELPPNLQGIWAGNWSPPWHGDFSTDANLELAVDGMMAANLPELMKGYFDLIEAGVPSWREGARRIAGCRGILYPARMQDQGTYFQQNKEWQWFNQVPIAGWLGHYFYDYWRYTGDRAFLRDHAIPYLKECALFYEDWFVPGADGKLRAIPSMSFESAIAENATIDLAVAREVLTNLIEGCETLGVEREGVARWRALLAKLPPYLINDASTTGGPPPPFHGLEGNSPAKPDGTLKEFAVPNMPEFPGHRHLSHLYPLFVSYEFDPERTPALWQAAEKAFEVKHRSVKSTETHYRMQAALCAARLGRGDDAWEYLTEMATGNALHTSLVPSHYDNLNVFNVDAIGAITAVLQNCLVFSLPGRLDLLPALPSAMPTGEIRGILARGGIRIDRLKWSPGKVEADLFVNARQTIVVGFPPKASGAKLKVNGKPSESRVDLQKGQTKLVLNY